MAESRASERPVKDFLWPQLRALPYFRALLRSVEASYYPDLALPHPILDVGCGDGHFASVAFDFKLDLGLDPWGEVLREARRYGAYRGLVQAEGACAPFPDGHFASAVSNSVLEHIADVDAVLHETARVLRPSAPFLFCVPNHQWLAGLSISSGLHKVGLSGLARAYERWFRAVSRHVHLDSPETWEARLAKAGFRLERWWHYFPPRALHALEWGHYFGLPSLIVRVLTGRWILAPWRWNLALTEGYARRYASAEATPQGTYTFYVARRV